ncbi:MAG: ATP-binding protein [Bacillota bacterium]|nr:ATP-binding protein [Bacillota bacterium]
MVNFKKLKYKIDSLTVFRALKDDPAIIALQKLLENFDVASYSDFVATFYPTGSNFSDYLHRLVLTDDNFYVRMVASGDKIDSDIVRAVRQELEHIEEISQITSDDIISEMGSPIDGLPHWQTSKYNFLKDFTTKLSNISSTGYGIFAQYTFFRVVDREIVPVSHPDYQSLDVLFEYERERNLIIKNTEALISGEGASNMLLYGDMGTGKSSTIKAVAAAYSNQGLRIVEIKKNQLFQIPDIMEQLSSNPLKFILFIDDLSFSGNDDNFSALKATLEGSISGCGDNTVIYATSNRRHLVRESTADRNTDELHLNDMLQETMSLAARFGLTITFSKPGKDEYLSIVRSLAEEYGLCVIDNTKDAPTTGENPADSCKGNLLAPITEEELYKKAEAFAIRRSGRSPRTARQFIELLKIGI